MSYPDDFNAALFNQKWGDGPPRDYPEPSEITRFITELASRVTIDIALAFDAFHPGSSFELDGNLVDCIRDTIDDGAYKFIKAAIGERE